MATNPFGRGKDSVQSGETTSVASSSSGTGSTGGAGGSGGLTAFIDQGSEFEGKLSFRDTVRIDGKFCGEITSENTLIVGESGEIEADIFSKTVSISGTVSGNVIAETTAATYKQLLEGHVYPDLGRQRLVRLKHSDVQRLYETLRLEGRNRREKWQWIPLMRI